MAKPPAKDWLCIAIDFFFGAVFADFWLVIGFLRLAAKWQHSEWFEFWILFFACSLAFGSLAALYRNQFWSNYETYSVIPPVEESLSRGKKIILWIVFALGCAAPGLLFFR